MLVFSVHFLLSLRPPGSPLFPYTTLFRSSVTPLTGWASERFGAKRVWLGSLLLLLIGSVLAGAAWSLDRKSTRLNSSHTVTSYAVYCLNKKKITQINNAAVCDNDCVIVII